MSKSTIIAVAGKGGVGKTSLSATIVRCLTEKYPDKKILAIDADPAVGLSTALGIDVKMTIDDIRKEIIASVDEGDTRGAVELLGEAKYRIFDALVETDGYSFIAVGRPESAGFYCKINSYLKEVISILSDEFDYVVIDGEAGIEQIKDSSVIRLTIAPILSYITRSSATPFIVFITWQPFLLGSVIKIRCVTLSITRLLICSIPASPSITT